MLLLFSKEPSGTSCVDTLSLCDEFSVKLMKGNGHFVQALQMLLKCATLEYLIFFVG